MKGSRFSEEQIIGVLREHEAGAKTEEVCRRHGISSATFYKWKAKYGGLDVSEARRLKSLEDENRRLKKLLAEANAARILLRGLPQREARSRHQFLRLGQHVASSDRLVHGGFSVRELNISSTHSAGLPLPRDTR